MTALLVALGASVGAVLRYLAGHWFDDRFPVGTLVVNVAGSFMLGAFSARSRRWCCPGRCSRCSGRASAALVACAAGFSLYA